MGRLVDTPGYGNSYLKYLNNHNKKKLIKNYLVFSS